MTPDERIVAALEEMGNLLKVLRENGRGAEPANRDDVAFAAEMAVATLLKHVIAELRQPDGTLRQST